MDLRLQEWTWGCKDHLVSFKLFIILMDQGDIRHSIESNTTPFISVVGIVKFKRIIAEILQFTSMASRNNTSCNACGMEVSASYLSKHFQRYHNSKTKTFSCNDCEKKSFEKNRLEKTVTQCLKKGESIIWSCLALTVKKNLDQKWHWEPTRRRSMQTFFE